jgi:starch-binding outer membrane protein, SusD/RagB family
MGITGSCRKSFLDVKPAGGLNKFVLATDEGINTLLVGAYSMLDGVSAGFEGEYPSGSGWESASSNWLYGSVRGMEANIGSDAGMESDVVMIQTFTELPESSWLGVKWREVYDAISRCNCIIPVINQSLAVGSIDQAKADLYLKQVRTLRGWYHFEAWRMWKKIPYVDENTDVVTVSNKEDVRSKIIADLSQGTSLPDNMGMIGRFNGTVAKVLLAQAMMQMNHDYSGALPLLQDVKVNGKKPNGSVIGLAPTYGEIFDIVNRNDIESVYTVQTSVNDDSGGYNGGFGEVLNFPYKTGSSPSGCCGFFQPTQEFVNSFRTVGGLPLLDNSYNTAANQLLRDQGVPGGGVWDSTVTYNKYPAYSWDSTYFSGKEACTVYDPAHPFTDLCYVSIIPDNKGNNPLTSPTAWRLKWTEDNSKPVDPRLDWTVGRRGIPYWDWGVHTGSDWIRDQEYAGPYSPKKQVYKKSQEGKYTEVGSWTSGFTANGYRMIRYADVLLLLAECQIETGDLNSALANVNLVRERAANPAGFVKESDGLTAAATYDVKPYPLFPDQAYARLALRMERKLELGMEGHRWFDLNRWGIMVDELNRVLNYEKTMPWGSSLYWQASIGQEDITYPIPQHQIDISHGNLVQNR